MLNLHAHPPQLDPLELYLFLVLASRKGATASRSPFVATSWQRSPGSGRAMAWSPQLLRRARPGAGGGGGAPHPRPPHGHDRGPLLFDMAAESDEDLELDAPPHATTAQLLSTSDPEVIFMGSDEGLQDMDDDGPVVDSFGRPNLAPLHERFVEEMPDGRFDLFGDEPVHSRAPRVPPAGVPGHVTEPPGLREPGSAKVPRPPKEPRPARDQRRHNEPPVQPGQDLRGHRRNEPPPRADRGPAAEEEVKLCCAMCSRVHRWSPSTPCQYCGANKFFDPRAPQKHHTAFGTWMYMPHDSSGPPPSSQGSQTSSSRRRRRRRRNGRPDDPPDDPEGDELHQEEHAESEQPTNDPVLPDEAAETPENPFHFEEEPQRTPVRPSRPPSMAASQRVTPGPALQDPIDQLSKALAKLIKKGNSSEASWNSMMGPSKGIKFRGGAAPAPPKWYFNPEDVRAYDRYERKVLLWEMQARHFMSQAEIGLTLYASLQGEAEQQLEFLEMSEVYSKTGVKTILGLLKSAFQQKQVYVKRHYLHTYENISRLGSESLRTFINRYKRTELALKAVGVDIALSYDAEARGSRLLDRCRLSQDQQRLVLVGTNQDMSFDAIGSALVMQFPDYRPPPPIAQAYQSSKGPGGKGFPPKHFSSGTTSSGMSSASTAPTLASSYRKGDGKNRPRRVFQTVNETMDGSPDGEAEDPPAPEDPSFDFEEPANEEDAGDDIDGTDDNHGAEDVESLMHALTVTARKLAAMNQGRKFRNAPKKSIEQRKQESPCAACGQLGHWAGDEACTVSAKKGKGSGKSKAASSSDKSDGKKVFTVNHYTGFQTHEEAEGCSDVEYEPHDVLVVFQTSQLPAASMKHAAHFMILDSACQRSCTGSQWFNEHQMIMNKFGYDIPIKSSYEKFKFGAGEPLTSNQLAFLPAGIRGHVCVFGVHVLAADIPFLGSLSVMHKLSLTLDFANQIAVLGVFDGLKVPLVKVLGHLAIKITEFPTTDSHALMSWSHDSPVCKKLMHSKEHEVIILPPPAAFGTADLEPADLPQTVLHARRASDIGREVMGQLGQKADPPDHERVDANGGLSQDGHHAARAVQGNASVRHQEAQQECQYRQGWTGQGLQGQEDRSDTGKSTTAKSTGIFVTELQHGSRADARTSEGQDKQSQPHGLCSDQSIRQDTNMQSPGLHPLRQRMGQLRKVQSMLPEVALERRGRRLEVGWLLLQTLALAAVTLDGGGIDHSGLPGALDAGARGDYADPSAQAAAFASCPTKAQVQGTINDLLGSGPWIDSSSASRLRCPDGQRQHLRHPSQPHLKLGLRKRLSGNMAKNVKTLENEVNVLDHMPYKEIIKNKVDLLELYSGAARPTALAKQHGLTSLQPFEKDDGYDLNVRQVRKWCTQAINQFRPLLLLVGYPCTLYNIFNENLNYSSPDRRQELYELRQADLDGLRFAIQRCLQQLANGDLFFLENPLRSRLWDQPEVLRLAQHPDVIKGSCDSGAYGATDKDGYVIIKSFGYLTNSTEIAKELSCRMTKEEKTHARPLEGQRVTDSQVYPVKMVHALLRGLRAEAQRRDPARFQPVHWVLYAQPVHDEQRWTQALDMVKKLFGNTSARTITLKPSSEIYQIVSELVPWELSRVQATSRPMIRRLPQDFPYTHRGSAIQFNDNTFELESEDLGALEFPRQKFGRPVAFAIFFYGVAEDEDKKPDKPKEQEPHHHIPGLKTDVSFPGLPAGIPREVQASVARLHVNAGHPARQEMIRLLTMHGAITSQILSCIDHLQCGSCKRTQLPQQPRPAAIPTMSGQFGDRLQIDRYWVRDLTGANHCFLGIVDMATNYQQTIRLTGQGAKDVYHALCQVWFKPFGHPLVIEADDDRNFEGEFKERIEGFGTHLLIVPAEAHWRIGSIERKNAILRSTMEKMIDEYGVTHPEMLDDIALAATQAINSSVTSKGRTPYQAVFGRLPRFPGDILGDERALLANYDAVYAEEMRSHALRIIAETRASHAVRRALLRKTAPSREEAQAILPGSMAAYWRWQKKSKGRKRGGYVLARLMSHDPDNKSAWLHNGNSVVQATYEQIRPAFGIENWCPSSQDIQMLRDGSTRLQKGLWQDERGPPPPRLDQHLKLNLNGLSQYLTW